MNQPKFTGIWIPSEVLSQPLSPSAKMAYGIMSALDNEEGCYASNGYLATVLSVSDRQVRTIIAELEATKLIIRGVSGGVRIIRTVEKDALCKTLGVEENFLPRRKKTSAGGGRKLPTDSIGYNKDEIGLVQLPFSTESFKNTWNTYCNHRRQMKRPISKVSILTMFGQFKEWGEHESTAALLQSITRGWVGVFPVPKQPKPLGSSDHRTF